MRIEIGETIIDDNYLMTPQIEERMLSEEKFTLRNAFSGNMSFTIMDIDKKYNQVLFMGKDIKYYLDDTHYRTYTINSVEYDKDRIKIKANDKMLDLDGIYWNTQLEYPATYEQMLNEMAKQGGFVIKTTDYPRKDATLTKKPNITNFTLREAIKHFGEATLTIPVFNKDNELELKWFTGNKVEIDDYVITSFKDSPLLDPIDKVTVIIGENTYSDGVGENEYQVKDNIFIDNADTYLQELHDKIYSFKYYPFKATIINKNFQLEEDPDNTFNTLDLKLGDTLVYNGKEYLYTGGTIDSVFKLSAETKGKSLIQEKQTNKNTVQGVIEDLTNLVGNVNPDAILEEAQENATELINNGFGGYVRVYPDKILIMNTDNENTATEIWKWSLGGLGYSNTGVDGTYETAITADGQIVADFVTTGTMSVERIRGLADDLAGIKSDIELNNNEIKLQVSQQEDNINEILEQNDVLSQTVEGLVNERTTVGGFNLIRNAILSFGNEFWDGEVKSYFDSETQQQSGQNGGWLLQSGTATQTVQVKNGVYTISFIYKKILELANCRVTVNDVDIALTEMEYTEVSETIEVKNNAVTISITSDTNDSAYLLNLMLNEGAVKQPYSNNANETVTDTVKIGKGMEITSNIVNTKLNADADGVRITNVKSNEIVTEFTDKGTKTKELVVENNSQITGLLFTNIEEQTWISRM